MEDIIARIAEQKILEGIRKGEFKNLEGEGRPLTLEDLSQIPGEFRASYTILKNAGVLPEELQLHKEIVSLQRMIDCCMKEDEKQSLKMRLSKLLLKYNIMMERRGRRSY